MSLPPEIQVEPLAGRGIAYRLPRRGDPGLRAFGVITIIPIFLIGLTIVGALTLYALGLLEADAAPRDRGGAAVFALFFGGSMLLYVWRGIPAQLGRCRIELQQGRIRSINQAGFLRCSRSIPLGRARRIKVAHNYGHPNAASGRWPADWADLEIELDNGRRWHAATSFSHDLLGPLAGALADEINSRREAAAGDAVVVQLPSEVTGQLQPGDERFEQPAGSDVRVEQAGDGWRLEAPAPGFFGLPLGKFLVLFAVLLLVMGTGILVAAQSQAVGDRGADMLLPLGILAFMWAIWGIGMMTAVQQGTLRVMLRLAGRRLEILFQNRFGTSRRSFGADELDSVRVDASRFSSGSRTRQTPYLELQIDPRGGKLLGLLAMRDEQELRWLATVIRQYFDLPAYSSPPRANQALGWAKDAAAPGPTAVILLGGLMLGLLVAGGQFALAAGLAGEVAAGARAGEVEPKFLSLQIAGNQRLTSLAFSPDGQRLAIGSMDKTVSIWQRDEPGRFSFRSPSWQQVAAVDQQETWISQVAYSPDGSRIVSNGTDGAIAVCSAADGRPLETLQGHRMGVRCLAFSPDGAMLASGSSDRTIRIWEMPQGRHVATLVGHESLVNSVAFSHDGRLLASAAAFPNSWKRGNEGEVIVWDLDEPLPTELTYVENRRRKREDVISRQLRLKIEGHAEGADHVAFSPDDRLLATGSNRDNTLRLWDVASGQPLRKWSETSGPLDFSPNGRLLAAICLQSRSICCKDIDSGETVCRYTNLTAGPMSIAFSPDGSILANTGMNVFKTWPVPEL